MYFWLQFFITISVLALMLLGGFNAYRYLNNKLRSSHTLWGILLHTLLLFITLGAIYFVGLFIMMLAYKFIVD